MVSVNGNNHSNALIQVRNLDKKYQRGSEEIHVLQGLNLDVDEREFVAFMGPSGSGKTTLLNLLGGLDLPSAGSITVAGDEISHMSARKLTSWRARHVGFIFQLYNLIPVLTAFQNVEMPLLLTNLSKPERRSHVEAALSIVGLADRIHHYPRQLSGGQEQRVAVARAIVSDPTFLLCDEPTGRASEETNITRGPFAPMFSNDSKERGHLPQIQLNHKFSKNIDGYVLFEWFFPGEFYADSRSNASFLRGQMQFKL